ncbi:flagellar biosynthetic protein FliP [Orenia metallireducens]|jgi:flagellar biosynthetic protein FliP|uniref:Flagellar biosynthetic protein FliP n=1 Tax=Orenia metallireducens TaxID=1413210 RepID=A0A285FPH8_9FIRM|nr:flagellar type III secretion system pore protein FliP [Orenia metallireducens]PRX33661.1 flagellar biosynthetic protein FliP [Orenia metallireducens]SNY12993.1 flagellar biosynthetic protein FliP [Orenia metallireducens]
MKQRWVQIILLTLMIVIITQNSVLAETKFTIPNLKIEIGDGTEGGGPQDLALSLKILFLLTTLTLAPAILILVTSFTRIIVVLSLLRRALATQQMPPNQVIIGLAIFMTIYIMAPVWTQINDQALQPYLNEEINQGVALETALNPLREFMFKQTREKDLALFVNMSKVDRPNNKDDIPTYVLVPAFVISELKTAFQIGFMIYLPFIVIDMIVASTLMSMGMMMLPPVMISLPFKILLFVLVDGWYLVIKSLVETFH